MEKYVKYFAVKTDDMLICMGIAENIGERVKLLREEMGISQYAMADKLTAEYGEDVSQGTIGHIEVGRRLPSVPVLVAMANLLETTTDYLLGRITIQSSPAAIEEDLQTGGISGRLAELYRRLSPDRQRQVYQFAEALGMIEDRNAQQRAINERQLRGLLTVMERRVGFVRTREILADFAAAHPEMGFVVDGTAAGSIGLDGEEGGAQAR